jgi:hypothetical protein
MGFKLVKVGAGSTASVVQANNATIEAVVSNFVAYNTSGSAQTFTLFSDGVQILSESVPANGSYRLTDKFNIPAATTLTATTGADVTATVSIYEGVVDEAGALTAAQQAAADADAARVLAEAALGTTTNPIITGSITEDVYELAGTEINPTNGSIQYKTLTADVTFTETLSSGQSVLLRLVNGASYAVTYPTTIWVKGAAPTLTAHDALVFWKEGTTLYGAYVGTLVGA